MLSKVSQASIPHHLANKLLPLHPTFIPLPPPLTLPPLALPSTLFLMASPLQSSPCPNSPTSSRRSKSWLPTPQIHRSPSRCILAPPRPGNLTCPSEARHAPSHIDVSHTTRRHFSALACRLAPPCVTPRRNITLITSTHTYTHFTHNSLTCKGHPTRHHKPETKTRHKPRLIHL